MGEQQEELRSALGRDPSQTRENRAQMRNRMAGMARVAKSSDASYPMGPRSAPVLTPRPPFRRSVMHASFLRTREDLENLSPEVQRDLDRRARVDAKKPRLIRAAARADVEAERVARREKRKADKTARSGRAKVARAAQKASIEAKGRPLTEHERRICGVKP